MSRDKRILIVENEEEYQDLIATILEVGGWPYEVAGNALDAINLLRWFEPALVLLEIMMPRHEGFSVYHRMKRDTFLRQTPIVVVSWVSDIALVNLQAMGKQPKNGHPYGSGVASVDRLSSLEPEGFVGKPIDPTLLLNEVERILT